MSSKLNDKDERRRILREIKHWNIGIAPNGALASEHSFVHHAVPNILETSSKPSKEAMPIITSSKWTENLVQSDASNPYDATTLKSLSICAHIFRHDAEFAAIKERSEQKTHCKDYRVVAHVKLDNIARLTTEFDNEIKEAHEHWPQNPQKSWDKLCQIWNKYGFLWPEKLHLGYRKQKDTSIPSPSSQDQQQSPQAYSIVWRTNLRPIYEFFPETHADKKRFMLDIICHVSSLVVYRDSLFRLKNVKTGHYLCNNSTESDDTLWKFHNTDSVFYRSPFIFLESSLFLCSQQQQEARLTVLSKDGLLHGKRNSVKLIEIDIPNEDSVDRRLSWYINSPHHQRTSNNRKAHVFELDKAIENYKCLSDKDDIILCQSTYYLRTDNHHNSFKSLTPLPLISCSPMSHRSSGIATKSPISMISMDEQSESNSTLPTSRGNSFSSNSPYLGKSSQWLPFNADVCIELLENNGQTKQVSVEFQWLLELAPSAPVKSKDCISTVISTTDSPLALTTTTNQKETYNSNFQISSMVSAPVNYSLFFEKPQKSQWLDGNTKLYNMGGDNLSEESSVSLEIVDNYLHMDSNSKYSTPAGSMKSIPSSESNNIMPVLSAKKKGKQPLHATRSHIPSPHHPDKDSSSDSNTSDSDWTESLSPSPSPSLGASLTPVPNRNMPMHGSSSPLSLTEAEAFKKQIQETYEAKENAYASIYRNIFARTTPSSNTTSQIRYYDDDDDDDDEDAAAHHGSSLVRSYTTTPRSRFSQPTPTSSANLSPEEKILRKRSREVSFMLLVQPETKQQMWVRAMKQSTLSHWLQSLSPGTNKKKKEQIARAMTDTSDTYASATSSNHHGAPSAAETIRLQHYSNNSKTIKKKKGFYYNKNSFRRQRGIVI